MAIRIQSALPKTGKLIVPFKASALSDTLDALGIVSYAHSIRKKKAQLTCIVQEDISYELICLDESSDYKRIKELAWKHSVSIDLVEEQTPFVYFHSHCASMEIDAYLSGMINGFYNIKLFKSGEKSKKLAHKQDIAIFAEHIEELDTRANEIWQTTLAQLALRDLVNSPANHMTANDLANWAVNAGRNNGYQVTILDRDELKSLGCEALLSVNRGSEHPPKMIIMEYKGDSSNNSPSIGIVGKGVTFDTGGVSIKGAQNMHYMKSDMGGGATVLALVDLVARLKWPINLVGIVPATDNMVDSQSIVPGDVISSYSGKSIEVIDTDAEGRLILADGLNYMVKQHQPDVLIDIATLTGSAVRTFGYHGAAMLGNDVKTMDLLLKVGQAWGEKVWPLPLWDEYKENMSSDIADVKNYSGRPMTGAIDAAVFLEHFIEDHQNWVHLDIAGVAFGQMPGARDKSASGYGPKLLLEFIRSLLND